MVEFITCPVCRGSGSKSVKQPCPICNNGKTYDGMTCHKCYGSGHIVYIQHCTQCGGHGKIRK